MPWKPGQSGNPSGRPRGSKDKRTELRAVFASRSQELIDKVIDMALNGDSTAMRLCIDRLVSPIRAGSEPIEFKMPKNGKACDAILTGLAHGKVSPDTAAHLLQAIASHKAAVDIDDLLARVEKLENAKP